MQRREGIANLIQAAVFIGGALYFGRRWQTFALIFGVAGASQLLLGAAILAGQAGRRACIAVNLLSLAAMALLGGLYLQIGLHIGRTFSPEAARTAEQIMAGFLIALPYGVIVPLWQLLKRPPSPSSGIAGGGGVAAALILPPLMALPQDVTLYPEIDGATAAAWLRAEGDPGPAPTGSGPVLLAVARPGEDGNQRLGWAEGDDLAAALQELRALPGVEGAEALILEAALQESPLSPIAPSGFALLRPGVDGMRADKGLIPASVLWQYAPKRAQILPEVSIPMVSLRGRAGATSRVRTRGWLATAADVTPTRGPWTEGPELSPEALVEAALLGGRHLRANQKEDGRFTYVVEGPSGRRKGGYNFPRHAGTMWYFARLASRTGDPDMTEGLVRSADWLEKRSERNPNGGRYVLDPSRGDDKAWVGTTALASLALAESGVKPELLADYARHIASSVDAEGRVRGNFDVPSATWPEQHEITYAQGQATLALALAERAGVEGISDALDRAIAYIDGPYWPDPAVNLGLLDEHWMCLTSVAVDSVRGAPTGESVCRAYLLDQPAPVAGSAFEPAGISQGGVAEAVIAMAEIERRRGVVGELHERSLAFGRWLLGLQYQVADAPFLGQPGNLIGGFRSKPWDLDVQIDTVQHIGCALLGVEQLLRGEEIPGAMP